MHEAPHKEGQKRGKVEAIVIVKYLHGRLGRGSCSAHGLCTVEPTQPTRRLLKTIGLEPCAEYVVVSTRRLSLKGGGVLSSGPGRR